MGTQGRLPGTAPSPAGARKNHRLACNKERIAEEQVNNLRDALKEARATLKLATAERRRAEEDMDAIEDGRRPDRGG